MSNQSITGQLAEGEREDAQVSRLITWLSAMAILFLVGIGAKAGMPGTMATPGCSGVSPWW
ncbi:hypothetical protein [Marinobacter similis]|uniref:hypothetical protein n=1 Tax=Marinobacter similis TaxID=1420916 RepID=UPI000A923A30|nr:hypothetical protein [Marinobacter similis]